MSKVFNAVRALHNTQLVQNLKTINFVLRNVIMRNGTVLFVNTERDPLLWRVTQHFARRAGQPYILQKWVGGTLTNHAAAMRYYASKQHQSANVATVPDLIFCSNVEANPLLFREANTVMIPTIGIMHTNTRNRLVDNDPHVTYPLPTNSPRSLSTVYFCNKIISDVILHHRRKMSAMSLYRIPPASTSASSVLDSPYAASKVSAAMARRGGARSILENQDHPMYGHSDVADARISSFAQQPEHRWSPAEKKYYLRHPAAAQKWAEKHSQAGKEEPDPTYLMGMAERDPIVAQHLAAKLFGDPAATEEDIRDAAEDDATRAFRLQTEEEERAANWRPLQAKRFDQYGLKSTNFSPTTFS